MDDPPTDNEAFVDKFMAEHGVPTTERHTCLLALMEEIKQSPATVMTEVQVAATRQSSTPQEKPPPSPDSSSDRSNYPSPSGAPADDDGGETTSLKTKKQQNWFASKFLTSLSPSDAEIRAIARAHKASYAASLLALRSTALDEEDDYCIAVKSPKQKSLSGTTTACKLKKSKTQTKIKI
jgi:hypothetical protein